MLSSVIHRMDSYGGVQSRILRRMIHSTMHTQQILRPTAKTTENRKREKSALRRLLKPPLLHSLKEVVSPALKKKFSFSYTSHIPTFFRLFWGFFHAHSLHCYTSSQGKFTKIDFLLIAQRTNQKVFLSYSEVFFGTSKI